MDSSLDDLGPALPCQCQLRGSKQPQDHPPCDLVRQGRQEINALRLGLRQENLLPLVDSSQGDRGSPLLCAATDPVRWLLCLP